MTQTRRTILLVEDEADIRELFTLVLTQAEYAVVAVEAGQAGLEILGNRPVDLLVTDYHLPDMTGADVIRTARERLPQLRTVLISGEAKVEALARACGAQAWYRKGEPLDRFIGIIGTALDTTAWEPAGEM